MKQMALNILEVLTPMKGHCLVKKKQEKSALCYEQVQGYIPVTEKKIWPEGREVAGWMHLKRTADV